MLRRRERKRTRARLAVQVVAGVGALIAERGAPAQDTWSFRSPQSRPGPRHSSAVAFDTARQQAVLFGGVNGTTENGETWLMSTGGWTQATPAQAPSARVGHAMAYDSHRQVVVLFGGRSSGTFLNDTWEWNGTNWTQPPVTGAAPSARYLTAMVFDEHSGMCVLFGGSTGNQVHGDTWTWDGSSWSQAMPVHSPPARDVHGMTYDGLDQRVVLFGGSSAGAPPARDDTWLWDGVDWSQRHPLHSPAARAGLRLAFDRRRGLVVLFGGDDQSIGYDDTWTWDGTDWTLVQPAQGIRPTGRYGHAMFFDELSQSVLLFGGQDGRPTVNGEQWAFENPTDPVVRDVGVGCSGSNGLVPRSLIGAPPRIGRVVSVGLVQARPNGTAIVLLGLTPLRLDLGSLGAPGCTVLPSLDAAFAVPTDSFGRGTLLMTVPSATSGVGMPILAQYLVLDPGANSFGVVVSNGTWMLVGL